MEEYTNPMQNIGYINQDFQTIYTQLLDLAKELTDKWDPSQSNESDPLVVIIKEMAILADKLHYAMNKEGLENFPESVTQLANARELFDQGGYTMQWYVGSTGEIYLRWIDSEGEANTYTVPMFTMLSDEEADKIYTTTREVVLDKSGVISEPVEIIQGTVHDYEINGDSLITTQNLDEENRLYFRDYNIAENGIFIRNDNSENWFEWKAVDNLYTYKYGSLIFKFGVLQDNSTCYIEFPEYAGDIIGSGIRIKYILTDGASGKSISDFEVTKVKFRTLTEEEIDRYIATGEPMDKAGSYGIQGKGCLFVEKIDGDYLNVVGLPAVKLAAILREEFNLNIM